VATEGFFGREARRLCHHTRSGVQGWSSGGVWCKAPKADKYVKIYCYRNLFIFFIETSAVTVEVTDNCLKAFNVPFSSFFVGADDSVDIVYRPN